MEKTCSNLTHIYLATNNIYFSDIYYAFLQLYSDILIIFDIFHEFNFDN
jgi:hypothetical protein